jgi:hypothetical protein
MPRGVEARDDAAAGGIIAIVVPQRCRLASAVERDPLTSSFQLSMQSLISTVYLNPTVTLEIDFSSFRDQSSRVQTNSNTYTKISWRLIFRHV